MFKSIEIPIPFFVFKDVIDLLDLDGQVKFLSAKEKEYACDVVDGRQTYILIRIESKS